MRSRYVHVPFFVRIKEIWKNNIFSEAAPNCLEKCFGQPPVDALVKIEITLASTGNVPRHFGIIYRWAYPKVYEFRRLISKFSDSE